MEGTIVMVQQGAPLTAFKRGSGAHIGVDLVIVRSGDSALLYGDTDIAANGRITQPVVFPLAGVVPDLHRRRIVLDGGAALDSVVSRHRLVVECGGSGVPASPC